MTAVFAILAFTFLALFLHPYFTYPASLKLFRYRPLHCTATGPLPSATMVFAAYNEEVSLPEKIANLRAIKALHPDIQILAYSDCSTDATLAILQAASDLLRVVPSTERTGKATGMRRMVAEATGEIVIFTDANVILDPASVAPLLRYFSDPDVGGVAGTLKYTNEDASVTAKVGGMYWRLEELLKRRESWVGSIMGADGSIFATRRALYPEVPPHLLDDMTVSMSVTFAGKRLIHAEDVIAYEKNATTSSDEFRRKRRIACRAFNTHRHLWPAICRDYGAGDLYKYLSHKLLRWFGMVLMILGGAFVTLALLSSGHGLLLLVMVVLALGAVLLGRAGIGGLRTGYEALISIVATFYGIVDAYRGKTYQTWTPAVSRD